MFGYDINDILHGRKKKTLARNTVAKKKARRKMAKLSRIKNGKKIK